MHEAKEIPVSEIDPDPDQPRKDFPAASLLELGNNMLALGQILPIVVVWIANLKRYILIDGERRWKAAQLIGIKTLHAMVLLEKPTPSQLKLIQLGIEFHKSGLSPMEKSNALAGAMALNNWSQSELVKHLNIPQPTVSRLLGYQRLAPELQELLHRGEFESDKAQVLSQEPDHAKQRELLSLAKDTPRALLRRKIRMPGQGTEPKTDVARFYMPGFHVTLQRSGMSLATAIDSLAETVRVLKKGHAAHHSIESQQRIMRDTAKASQTKTSIQESRGV